MGRVGADGLLPRFIWAAPLVGVVGETARGRRHDGTSGRRAAAAAAILDGAAAGDLSLSLPVGLRMVAKMTTQQDGVDTLTWALEKNNGYSSRFPCFGEGVYLLLGDVGALCCMDKLEPPAKPSANLLLLETSLSLPTSARLGDTVSMAVEEDEEEAQKDMMKERHDEADDEQGEGVTSTLERLDSEMILANYSRQKRLFYASAINTQCGTRDQI
uniref:Uncharacterized protein n=1 Tax=Oryza rufipogon TaxID=4529 RepID=A0A0E0P932_ORYRU